MDAQLLHSLVADIAVSLTFGALVVCLSVVSRHAALRGAVVYAAGYLGFTAGAALFLLLVDKETQSGRHPWVSHLAVMAAMAGCAAMVHGLARLLDVATHRGLALGAWALAGGIAALSWWPWPWPEKSALNMLFSLGNLLGVVGLLFVLLRPHPQPYRLPAWAAGGCVLLLAPLYLLAYLQGLPGLSLAVLPSYRHWVWLDLALWNTFNLCVMMLASFRALLILARQARTDPLTGCLNRRGLDEEVALLATRVSPNVPVVVLSMDIDHFKAINDRWGHAAGDAYLKAFAAELKACIRQTDLLARTGGEEFVALLIGSDESAGHRVATKILEGVRRLRVPHDQHEIQTTVSVGLGAGQGLASPKALQALQARSDEAVYAAKRGGRDRIGLTAHDATPPA